MLVNRIIQITMIEYELLHVLIMNLFYDTFYINDLSNDTKTIVSSQSRTISLNIDSQLFFNHVILYFLFSQIRLKNYGRFHRFFLKSFNILYYRSGRDCFILIAN